MKSQSMIYPNPQIYHDLEIMFVHVPKTAGTSIERTLLENLEGEVGGHTTAMGFQKKYPEHFASYFKFAVVRHPVDRFISAFEYLIQQPVHKALNNRIIHDCQNLNCFVSRAIESPELIDNIIHLLPQYSFLCDKRGSILVDSVFKYENLKEGWSEISRKIGKDLPPLPRLNQSNRKRVSGRWSSQVKSLVGKIYADDFSLFGYQL